jgi:LPXTG-motif cell wall-anchored protein/uncharacterized repeat protein (TIGR02543 family)
MPETTIRGANTTGHFRHRARALGALGAALLVTAGSLAFAAPAHAASQTAVFDDVTYTFDDAAVAAGATVTDFTQAGRTSLSIPASITVDGVSYAVTAIGEFALDGNGDGTGLSSLTLPDSITSIGLAALAGNELTTIDLPDSLTLIGDTAFAYNSLESLVIPNSVTTIENYAFSQNALTTLDLGTGVISIGWFAFEMNQLTTLAIPDSVTDIGSFAFTYNQLRDVTLGSSVGNVGDGAFTLNYDYDPAASPEPDWHAFTADSATLESVAFTGPAPAIADPADFPNFMPAGTGLGTYPDRDIYGSLGPAYGVTVYYPLAYGAPQTAGGFTTTPWYGYPTQGIADVSFAMNGHGDPVRTQPINVGSLATEPQPDPTATGWTFTGWFTDAALATAFDFATPITAATVIHAGWTEDVAPPAPTATVSFALNGHGTAIPNQTVEIGTVATKPSDPTATGWTFTGWFTDAGLATGFDFATPITAAIVLHAGWTADAVIPPTDKPTPPVTPPAIVPPAAQPAGAAPLAKTGTNDPSGTVFAALAALALGGGVLFVRRRKQQQ